MNLHRLSGLDMHLFTETGASTPNLTPIRSRSSSDEKHLFRGRVKQRRAIDIERVSESMSRVSVPETEEKKEEESRYDVSKSSMIPEM
jgi:hypothetical protein